jgi:hypothetical protein
MDTMTADNTTTDIKPALDFYINLSYGYISEHILRDRYGSALYLTPEGLARLGQVAGWIAGIRHANPDFAAKAAEHFDRAVRSVLAGSEPVEFPCRDGSVRAPRRQVILTDDGTFGGFGILWYGAVRNDQRLDLATTLVNDATPWERALDEADRSMGLNKRLEQVRWYTPTWVNETTPAWMRQTSEVIHYRFESNGGLIYRGPGAGQTFTVSLDDSWLWGVHT